MMIVYQNKIKKKSGDTVCPILRSCGADQDSCFSTIASNTPAVSYHNPVHHATKCCAVQPRRYHLGPAELTKSRASAVPTTHQHDASPVFVLHFTPLLSSSQLHTRTSDLTSTSLSCCRYHLGPAEPRATPQWWPTTHQHNNHKPVNLATTYCYVLPQVPLGSCGADQEPRLSSGQQHTSTMHHNSVCCISPHCLAAGTTWAPQS
jgi:hypothetical protein